MIIDVITIFPTFFSFFFDHSIIKRALKADKVVFNIHDLRKYSCNRYGSIDDKPYGGGVGMLLQFPPFYRCLQDIKKKSPYKIILLSPQGSLLTQKKAIRYVQQFQHLVILCGNYEGIDARILDYIDEEISIGDYILTGGEISAMVFIDVLIRLLPGVINSKSYLEDSHQNGLLKYSQYTKPAIYKDSAVPQILLSGNHQKIFQWRLRQSLTNTLLKRPDMLDSICLDDQQQKILSEIKENLNKKQRNKHE